MEEKYNEIKNNLKSGFNEIIDNMDIESALLDTCDTFKKLNNFKEKVINHDLEPNKYKNIIIEMLVSLFRKHPSISGTIIILNIIGSTEIYSDNFDNVEKDISDILNKFVSEKMSDTDISDLFDLSIDGILEDDEIGLLIGQVIIRATLIAISSEEGGYGSDDNMDDSVSLLNNITMIASKEIDDILKK